MVPRPCFFNIPARRRATTTRTIAPRPDGNTSLLNLNLQLMFERWRRLSIFTRASVRAARAAKSASNSTVESTAPLFQYRPRKETWAALAAPNRIFGPAYQSRKFSNSSPPPRGQTHITTYLFGVHASACLPARKHPEGWTPNIQASRGISVVFRAPPSQHSGREAHFL